MVTVVAARAPKANISARVRLIVRAPLWRGCYSAAGFVRAYARTSWLVSKVNEPSRLAPWATRFGSALPAGAGLCRGSSLSRVCPERSGGTRRRRALDWELSRRQDAWRGRTARLALAGVVTRVRDVGTASGRVRGRPRGGSGPRRCATALEAAGQAAACQRRAPLATPPGGGPPARPLASSPVIRALLRARPRPGRLARPEGVPLKLFVEKVVTSQQVVTAGGRRWSPEDSRVRRSAVAKNCPRACSPRAR
jgi:hypothetical protein